MSHIPFQQQNLTNFKKCWHCGSEFRGKAWVAIHNEEHFYLCQECALNEDKATYKHIYLKNNGPKFREKEAV